MKMIKADRAAVRVARVVACTCWVSAEEAQVSFLAERVPLDLFTPP